MDRQIDCKPCFVASGSGREGKFRRKDGRNFRLLAEESSWCFAIIEAIDVSPDAKAAFAWELVECFISKQ